MYRGAGEGTEVFLVHPGGPFWAKKDDGAWSIPKGLADTGEDLLAAARREFHEETGFTAEGEFTPLGAFKQPGGKIVHAWAVEGDCDPSKLVQQSVRDGMAAEIGKTRALSRDRSRGLVSSPSEAQIKILRGQQPILLKLFEMLGVEPPA